MRNSIRMKIIRFLMRRWDYFLVAVNEDGNGAGMMTPDSEVLKVMLENIVFNREDFRGVLKQAIGAYLNRHIVERDEFIKTITE